MGSGASLSEKIQVPDVDELDEETCCKILGDKFNPNIFEIHMTNPIDRTISREGLLNLIHRGCTIDKTEERGITIRQLQEVYNEIIDRCEEEQWTRESRLNESCNSERYKLDLYTAIEDESAAAPIVSSVSLSVMNKFSSHSHSQTNNNNHRSNDFLVEDLKAVGITDGLAENDNGDSYVKSGREGFFPLDRIIEAASFNVLTAEASTLADEIRILNVITGHRPLESKPLESHDNYDQLNNVLRGRFVCTAWNKLIKSGVDMNPYYEILKNSSVTSMDRLDFSHLKEFTDDVAVRFVNSLPEKTLKTLEVDLHGCGIGVVGTKAIFNLPAKLPNLKRFKIRYAQHGPVAIQGLIDALKTHPNTIKLTKLTIIYCHLGPEAGKLLAEHLLVNNNKLKELCLSRNQLGPEGGKYIVKALKGNTVLRDLNLIDNHGLNNAANKELFNMLQQQRQLSIFHNGGDGHELKIHL
eukprot:gene11889-15907_t